MGHKDPFSYTPKQLIGFTKLAAKRRKSDLLDNLYIMRAAHHAKKDDMRKIEKELQRGK